MICKYFSHSFQRVSIVFVLTVKLNIDISKMAYLSLIQGLKLAKKSTRNFATRYEKVVAISQNLVAKSSSCIVLSAVYQNKI